jgi:hypothetical protein
MKSMPKFDRFSRKVYDTQFIEKKNIFSVSIFTDSKGQSYSERSFYKKAEMYRGH